MAHLIANKMKTKIIFCVLFTFGLMQVNVAQEKGDKNFYILYKGGKPIPKKIVYVLFDASDKLEKKGDILIFEIKKNTFMHNTKKHVLREINIDSIENVNFVSIPQLYETEERELKSRLDEIEVEKGFRPAPPISHKVLKVYIVKKSNKKIYSYEVDWLTSVF